MLNLIVKMFTIIIIIRMFYFLHDIRYTKYIFRASLERLSKKKKNAFNQHERNFS